jgi:exosome complex RNA-binding protein Rrp42 (RNase PH superfamily)
MWAIVTQRPVNDRDAVFAEKGGKLKHICWCIYEDIIVINVDGELQEAVMVIYIKYMNYIKIVY